MLIERLQCIFHLNLQQCISIIRGVIVGAPKGRSNPPNESLKDYMGCADVGVDTCALCRGTLPDWFRYSVKHPVRCFRFYL